jgi:hypothetical protein
MKNKPAAVFCAMCFVLGTLAPWGFIVLGAALSVFSADAQNSATAAYSTAFGILVLATSFLLKRLVNSMPKALS